MTVTRVLRHIRAPRQRVYEALFDPESVQQWMVPDGMTSQVQAFHAREGGTFRISLTFDDRDRVGKTEGATDTFEGRLVKLVPAGGSPGRGVRDRRSRGVRRDDHHLFAPKS